MSLWLRARAWFSGLVGPSDAECQGRLEAIFVAPAKGEPMRALEEVWVSEQGLDGDRYALGTGFWQSVDGCAVTLCSEEALAGSVHRAQGRFVHGEHRRNLVVSGIPIAAYRGRCVRIGEAVLAFQRLRPPCGYLERLLWRGASKALGKGAGICLCVVTPGRIRRGDAVVLLDSAQE